MAYENFTRDELIKNKKSKFWNLPEYVWAEVLIETLGFFTPSSKRIKDIYTKVKRILHKNKETGSQQIIEITISANHKLGLPTTKDCDYYRAFLKICDEQVDHNHKFKLPIKVPTRRLIRYAGKKEGSRTRKEVREWFDRMIGTIIKGGVYRAKNEEYDVGFTGTLFSQVVMYGEHKRTGEIADTNYVWLSPWFLSNYSYHYVRRIDLNFYKRLRKPIAKALYPLLETGFYASNSTSYSKKYSVLCNEFLLTKHQHISDIKRQLEPSLKELQRERFLSKWQIYKNADKGDYIITFWPGEKVSEDRKNKDDLKKLADKIQEQPKEMPSDISDENIRSEYLLQEILNVCGDIQNASAYNKIINNYPEHLIRATLTETRLADKANRINKNKGAYFMDTIKRLDNMRSQAHSRQS